MRTPLPIDDHLHTIARSVQENSCVIVEAPPGTGKTTRVAPALLTGNVDQQTLLIQPRRIAARAAANRIAKELGCQVGARVGYQVRFDSRRSKETELCCMTPGILLRMLQGDGVLSGVHAVVLDEFHERSVEYDLLLGMLTRIQSALRPELRIVIMSATLNTDGLLPFFVVPPPVITVAAPVYPVEIHHTPFRTSAINSRGGSLTRQIVEITTDKVTEATSSHEGDCLVFLPGAGEIHQVADRLSSVAERKNWQLLKLFGDMRPEDQDRVLLPSTERKVILSTNVAETSLTIDGVKLVVDSGYARVQRFSPASGLDSLVLEPISMASAAQRTGRAGRTSPGVCYRLWDKITERGRPNHLEPEIARVDLTGPVLQLLCWGESDVLAFPWLTPPKSEAVEHALALLEWLGATHFGKPTDLGRLMLKLPLHPRLARMLIEGRRLKIPESASLAAAMLSERDVFDRNNSPQANFATRGHSATGLNNSGEECDISRRVDALQSFLAGGRGESSLGTIKTAAAKNVERVAKQYCGILDTEMGNADTQNRSDATIGSALQLALLSAFPDRLAKRRKAGDARGLMVGGKGVKLEPSSSVRRSELFLCVNVDGKQADAAVRWASSIELDWLSERLLKRQVARFFNPTLGTIQSREQLLWLDLALIETPIATQCDEETARILACAAARQFGKLLPPKDKELHTWIGRVSWLSKQMPELGLPSFTEADLPDLLAPYCQGLRSVDEVKKLPWKSVIQNMIDGAHRRVLETHAPESYELPTGRKVYLQYEPDKPPVLAARIQDFFGLNETPRIAGGRIPLLLHLLAPNQRVQQVTDDLASFWKNTYPVVRKELRGRYPKHAWPEDPTSYVRQPKA